LVAQLIQAWPWWHDCPGGSGGSLAWLSDATAPWNTGISYESIQYYKKTHDTRNFAPIQRRLVYAHKSKEASSSAYCRVTGSSKTLLICMRSWSSNSSEFHKVQSAIFAKKIEFSQPMAGPSEIQVWKGDQTALNESAMTPWHV
jgi:hypothetical protein